MSQHTVTDTESLLIDKHVLISVTGGTPAAVEGDSTHDKIITLTGATTAAGSAGSFLSLSGNSSLNTGAATLAGGANAAGHVTLKLNHASASIKLQDSSGNNLFSVSNAGAFSWPNADITIAPASSDAADGKITTLAGGGAGAATRGAFLTLNGNEVATVGGSATLTGGAIASGNLTLKLGHSSAAIRLQDSSGNNLLSMSHGGNITLNASDAQITANTSDAADNKAVSIGGGGAVGSGRGGSVECWGNESANTGTVFIRAGNVTGGGITFATGGANRGVVDKDGLFGINITSSLAAMLHVVSSDANRRAVIIKGAAAQSYSLLDCQNSSGTSQLAITAEGLIDFGGTMANSSKNPTSDAPADWVELKIGGVQYFAPVYAA